VIYKISFDFYYVGLLKHDIVVDARSFAKRRCFVGVGKMVCR